MIPEITIEEVLVQTVIKIPLVDGVFPLKQLVVDDEVVATSTTFIELRETSFSFNPTIL